MHVGIALPDILKVVGPSAAIIFAAWIFMGFLQQRYDAAVERYRSAIDEIPEGKTAQPKGGITSANKSKYTKVVAC